MSNLLIIPTMGFAVYMLYRHIKGNLSGKKSCYQGISAAKCRRNRIFKHARK